MSAVQFFLPHLTATVAGIALPGAKFEFLLTGTTTPQTVYSNAALTIPRSNPVVCNGVGAMPTTYLDNTKVYRLRIYDKDGALLSGGDFDPLIPGVYPDASVLQPYVDACSASAASSAASAATALAAMSSVAVINNATAHAANRTVLAAMNPNLGPAYLSEDGREGMFEFITAATFAARWGLALTAAVAGDTLQGVHVAAASDATGASGAWVRVDDRITPSMFGAITNYQTGDRVDMIPPYGESSTPGSTDGVLVDSRIPCQALIDLIRLHENRRFIGDFSGGLWGLTANTNGNGLEIRVPIYAPRTFIGGEFRGIGAGTNLFYIRDLSYSRFEGRWHLRSGYDGGSGYGWALRQWENGVWIRNAGQAMWKHLTVSGFKRYGIQFDPLFDLTLTEYNNNIGFRFGKVYASSCGSKGGTAGQEFTINFTASARTGSSGSVGQRTDWTLDVGHEILRIGDIVKGPTGQYHSIQNKVGNVISVYPWSLSTAATGTLTSCHGGGIQLAGKDVAGTGADSFTGINCGVSLDLQNILHGTSWGDVINESCAIGVLCGTFNGIGGLGHTIGHMHSEGVSRDLLSIHSANVGLNILSVSAWAGQDYNDLFKFCEVLGPNDGTLLNTTSGLPCVGIFIDGTYHTSGTYYGLSSASTKSRNLVAKLSNNAATVGCKVADSLTVTLKYFEPFDRLIHNAFRARLEIVGTAGWAPTGAITVNLDTNDAAAAWAPTTAYVLNDLRNNDSGKVYKCTVAGTSAGAGGPTGTGTVIVDGTCTWTYVQAIGGITFKDGSTSYVIAAGAATGPVIVDFWLDTSGATLKWLIQPRTGVVTTSPIQSSGGKVGYAVGAGGSVTQATNKATGVTLNKLSGQITMNAASLAANTVVSFTLTNSQIAADDNVRVWVKGGNATPGSYRVDAEGSAAGSRIIVVENKTAGALAEAIVLGFTAGGAVIT